VRQRFRHEVRVYVSADLYVRLVREAASRRITVSACVRADLEEFYAIKEELTAPLEVRDDGGEVRRRIIHQLLAEMETRLVAGVDRLCVEFSNAVGRQSVLLGSMIDQAYTGIMVFLEGDIPAEARDARVENARLRVAAWRKGVARLIQKGKPTLLESAGQPAGPPDREESQKS
jgi:hypothetical protein